jgi:hypothetical protein
MSDFGELCPLFSTGVFNEHTFPNITMTNITACGNALVGTLTFTKVGNFTFGRTVLITEAFVRNRVKPGAVENMKLMHHTSQLAAGTEIASLTISVSIGDSEVYTWQPMTMATGVGTFTSSEILGLTYAVGTAASGGTYDLMVRYKEK